MKKENIKTIIVCLTLIVIATGFILTNRYEVVSLNSGDNSAYKIDNWTGEVTFLLASHEYELEKK